MKDHVFQTRPYESIGDKDGNNVEITKGSKWNEMTIIRRRVNLEMKRDQDQDQCLIKEKEYKSQSERKQMNKEEITEEKRIKG